MVSDGSSLLYIDTSGNPVVRIQEQNSFLDRTYHEGLAIYEADGKAGFVDIDGNRVIESQYEGALPFWNGVALVVVSENGEQRQAYIDRQGNYLWIAK